MTLAQCEVYTPVVGNEINDRRDQFMGKRLINLKHHVDDYECMWNGISKKKKEFIYSRYRRKTTAKFLFYSLFIWFILLYENTKI